MVLAYSLGGQAAAQMAPPQFYGLTLLLLFVLARRCGATPLGALARPVFAVTLPFVHWSFGRAVSRRMILHWPSICLRRFTYSSAGTRPEISGGSGSAFSL